MPTVCGCSGLIGGMSRIVGLGAGAVGEHFYLLMTALIVLTNLYSQVDLINKNTLYNKLYLLGGCTSRQCSKGPIIATVRLTLIGHAAMYVSSAPLV